VRPFRVFNLISDTTGGTSDTDADGDALSILLVGGQPLAALDSDPSTPGIQMLLASGTFLQIANDGSFTYDPNGAFEHLAVGENAVDSLTYEITDQCRGGTDSATVTFTVNGLNDLPVAVDDTGAVDEDGSAVIDVLANDSDPDANDVLVLTSAMAVSGATVQIQNNQLVYVADADVFDLLGDGEVVTDTVNVAALPSVRVRKLRNSSSLISPDASANSRWATAPLPVTWPRIGTL